MRIIIAVLLAALTHPTALAEDKVSAEQKKLIQENAFKCEDAGIKLKSLWGDWLGSWHYEGKGLFKRAEMTPIDCATTLQRLYKEGATETIDFFSHVRAFEDPRLWSSLPGLYTKFDGKNKEQIAGYLRARNVSFRSRTTQLAELIADYPAKKSANALDPNFRQKLVDLTDTAGGKDIDLFQKILPGKLILEALLELEHDEPDFLIHPIIDNLLKASSPPAEAFRHSTSKVPLTAQLVLLGHGSFFNPTFSFAQENAPENLKAALATKDDASTVNVIRSIASATQALQTKERQDFIERPNFHGNFCGLVIGKLATTKNEDLSKILFSLYEQAACSRFTGTVIEEAKIGKSEIELTRTRNIDLLANYPGEYASIANQILNAPGLKYSPDVYSKYQEMIKNKCDYRPELKPLFKLTEGHSGDLLNEAIEAKCDILIKEMARSMSSKDLDDFFTAKLNGKKIDPRYVSEILLGLNESGKSLSPESERKVRDAFGPRVFRDLEIAKRVNGPVAFDLLHAAEEKDTDELTNLHWKDLDIALITEKLTPEQRQLVDSIRLAQTDEQVRLALREALITSQKKVRLAKGGSGPLNESLDKFRSSGDMLAAMDQAKIVLDDTLTKNGRQARFNHKANSILDPIASGRVQDYSGTDFVLLLTAQAAGYESSNEVQVVIFTPAHILPGVVRLNSPSKIEAVETTVGGRGRTTIDVIDGKLPVDHRVVIAEDYLLEKLLGPAMKDEAQVAVTLLARAEKVLRIKQGQISLRQEPEDKSLGRPLSGPGLNETAFAFGSADYPVGDIERQSMDVVPKNLSGAEIAKLGVVREEHKSPLSRFEPAKAQTAVIEGRLSNKSPTAVWEETVADPMDAPLNHIVGSIRREVGWLNLTRHLPLAEKLHDRIREILEKLEPAQKTLIEQAAMSSNGVLVDVRSDNMSTIGNGLESPVQQKMGPAGFRMEYREFLIREDLLMDLSLKCTPEALIMRASGQSFCNSNVKLDDHRHLVGIRVLMQDAAPKGLSRLDIVLDADHSDDGDFKVEFRPIELEPQQ